MYGSIYRNTISIVEPGENCCVGNSAFVSWMTNLSLCTLVTFWTAKKQTKHSFFISNYNQLRYREEETSVPRQILAGIKTDLSVKKGQNG